MARSILVVDDDPLILLTIQKALSRVGYRISQAQDMSGVETALAHGPYDLLMLDLFLEKDSSDDILKKVLSVMPSIKVLRMSGTINVNKAVDFIEKPFRIDLLRQKVRDLIGDSA